MDKNPEPPKSFIQIVFEDIGSVVMTQQLIQATPLQVLALAEYLQFVGKNSLLEEHQKMLREKEAPQNKIMLPGSHWDLDVSD